GRRGTRRVGLNRRGLRRDLPLPVEQLDQQGAVDVRGRGRVEGALDVDAGLGAEHVGGPGVQVGQEHLGEHPQPHVPVDAAGLEEVHAGRAAADPTGGTGRQRESTTTESRLPASVTLPVSSAEKGRYPPWCVATTWSLTL